MGFGTIAFILYFDRITDTRLPGSKRRLVSLFKQLIGDPKRTAKAVTLVTTMWDEVSTESQRERAQTRFMQLQSEHWKDLIDHGARVAKFTNTQDSAVEVLRKAIDLINFQDWAAFDVHRPIRSRSFGPLFQQNLQERIDGLKQRVKGIEDDLAQETTRACPELVALLTNELSNVKNVLQAFETDMEEFKEKSDLARSTTPNSSTSRNQASNGTFQRAKGRFQQLWHRGKKTDDANQ
ncbi:hypothetical protein BJ165DRAFT_362943 [Panaeolus papilionaceus]|nr:hypothetical protein BJ165DRAFT_362943 [Panaeolus papilionaceus]